MFKHIVNEFSFSLSDYTTNLRKYLQMNYFNKSVRF